MSVDILESTISPEVFLYGAIFSLLLAVVLWLIRYFFLRRALFRLCGVPTSKYKLLSTNLIWPKRAIKLKGHNLRGTSGTIFLNKNDKSAYVCQYEPRLFNGRVKVRERYEMLLNMGILKEKYKFEDIKGAIRYFDHLELIKFESTVYRNLVGLQDEYRQAIHEWTPPNKQPLFKRDTNF